VSFLKRIHHPWGRFDPGAWALVRETTETYLPEGLLTIQTEVKTTLLALDIEGVTLQIESKMFAGEREISSTMRKLKQGFHGESLERPVRVVEDIDTVLPFLGHNVQCRKQTMEISDSNTVTRITLYYADREPYLLRRESKTVSTRDASEELSTSVLEVVGSSCRLLSLIRTTYQVKLTQKTAKGWRLTLATISPEVPGGIVSQTTMEFDDKGEIRQKSSVELLEYGFERLPPRGILRLWRPRPFR